jgi:predicted dehydrogenase
MIKTGLIGHGYWGKILESKLNILTDRRFIQTSGNYDPEKFEEVDWVFIATPANSHYRIVKDCICKKVNVFVEKPFCSSSEEAKELITLAKENNIKLCVDNVFLFKTELEPLKALNPEKIKFLWYKYGPFNDNLVNDLLYHDVYLLINNIGYRKIEKLKINIVEKDVLNFQFSYGHTEVYIDYSRITPGIKTKSIFADHIDINFDYNKEDSLLDFIQRAITGDLDFDHLQNLNFQTITLIEIIVKQLTVNYHEF